MDLIASILAGLNRIMNAASGLAFAPVAVVPGWLSITVVSAVLGVFFLLIFKYTSNQKAIGRVRDEVNANLIAAWLFKDSISVTIKSQLKVFLASFKLLYYAIIPMLVMIIPMCLILAQMGLWYQVRPLNLQDTPVLVKLRLNDQLNNFPEVIVKPSDFFKKTDGPLKLVSKKEVLWQIQPTKKGLHELIFEIEGNAYKKQFAVGDGLMRVSLKRPGNSLGDLLLHPLEKPFMKDSPVSSIEIVYPERDSKICGTDWWIVYFFICSMVFAFAVKPFFKVRI